MIPVSLVVMSGRSSQLPPDIDLDNSIFVVFAAGQSNCVGRATSQRMIQLTENMETPSGVRYFFKNNYTSTDNGSFVAPFEGSDHTKEPDQASVGYFGSYIQLAARLKRVSPNPVYVVMMGDGGTALKQNLTSPDWYEGSSGECFQIATQYFYSAAYPKIEAEQPGKTIIPIIDWHQGETDAGDADGIIGYATRFSGAGRFVDSLRASHSSLEDAFMIITKLYFQLTAGEDTINEFFETYAASQDNVGIVDISDINRKVDLTTDEKGGISTSGSDDGHTSYLGQIAKADRAYALIKARFFPSVDDSEHLTNTAFDPSTISSSGVRLQFSRGKVTIGTNSSITEVANDFSIGTFNSVSGTPKFKRDGKKGRIEFLNSFSGRVLSSAAIGTSLFGNATGFSVSFFMKPRHGQPSDNSMIFHDVRDTSNSNLSRVYCLLRTTGVINVVIAIGGTAVTVDTDSAIFTSGAQQKEKHIALTFANGGDLKIYVDKSLVKTASISSVNLANYVNNSNAFVIGAQRTGAGSFSSTAYYKGSLREFIIHTGVVYTQTDIDNLYLN